jgi:hypothetical protein
MPAPVPGSHHIGLGYLGWYIQLLIIYFFLSRTGGLYVCRSCVWSSSPAKDRVLSAFRVDRGFPITDQYLPQRRILDNARINVNRDTGRRA